MELFWVMNELRQQNRLTTPQSLGFFGTRPADHLTGYGQFASEWEWHYGYWLGSMNVVHQEIVIAGQHSLDRVLSTLGDRCSYAMRLDVFRLRDLLTISFASSIAGEERRSVK